MALRSRELSAVEHVTDALDRLAADPYNTVITLDDRALERAAALDAELAAGRWRGPLHGVAVGVKDLIDVAGLPTKCGSLVRESVAISNRAFNAITDTRSVPLKQNAPMSRARDANCAR